MSIRRRELEWWYEQRRCGDGDFIEVGGNIYHGKLIDGKGDFQDQKNGYSYAGGVKDGKPHGFGVLTGANGATESGEWFEGDFHGCMVGRYPGGDVVYWEYDHGNCMHSVLMRASGSCELDRQPCSADDARFVALKAAALDADARAQQLAAEAKAEVERYPLRERRLEIMLALMLARERHALTGAAADGCTPLAAALAALPSGLLAMIAEALAAHALEPPLLQLKTLAGGHGGSSCQRQGWIVLATFGLAAAVALLVYGAAAATDDAIG